MTSVKFDTKKLVYLAVLTALVIVLQLAGSFIKFGTFSVSLVLVPIAVGAVLCGPLGGLWLGLVFGAVVLISGDAGVFLGINTAGTIVTVLLKGLLCGFVSGLAYVFLKKFNSTVATVSAAVICPIVNTGVFVIGCYVFFLNTMTEWGSSFGYSNATSYIFLGMIGLNFFFELAVSIILAPVIVRLVSLVTKKIGK